jgi:hypothetical protein
MTDGFLSRWSKRKIDVMQGKPLAEPEIAAPQLKPVAEPGVKGVNDTSDESSHQGRLTAGDAKEAPAIPAPTLADAQSLTLESDFKPFMARGVASDVKNTAMKKLFTDPHYNVMDGLDTYIDDYSVSEPIPEAMLRQMASAQFLKLFDEKEPDPKSGEILGPAVPDDVRDDADIAATKVVAQSRQATDMSPDSSIPIQHDHTDLRLQPDHAAASKAAGRGSA